VGAVRRQVPDDLPHQPPGDGPDLAVGPQGLASVLGVAAESLIDAQSAQRAGVALANGQALLEADLAAPADDLPVQLGVGGKSERRPSMFFS